MAGRHASEIGACDNGALYAAAQPSMANYLSNAGYDTVMPGKMHFIGPDQFHGFNRGLTTDIYSSDFNWVKQEWIDIKKNQGHDYDEVMSNRQAYNAKGYTGEGVHIGQWQNALSYDEETHFRSLEYLRARGNKPDPCAGRLLPPPARGGWHALYHGAPRPVQVQLYTRPLSATLRPQNRPGRMDQFGRRPGV
jgi:arylsulfatase A-like enzyme